MAILHIGERTSLVLSHALSVSVSLNSTPRSQSCLIQSISSALRLLEPLVVPVLPGRCCTAAAMAAAATPVLALPLVESEPFVVDDDPFIWIAICRPLVAP